MPAIPANVRERVAELGRLSGPLDDSRAADIGRALAKTLADQMTRLVDPILVISLFEAQIAAEIRKTSGEQPSARLKKSPKLADVLQTFG